MTSLVRTRLRDATAPAHAEVDRIFSHFDLTTAAGYGAFLSAHAGALLPVEAWLDSRAPQVIADWPSRRRAAALAVDLAAMGQTAAPTEAFHSPDSPAAVIGVLYVVEGSRLGGKILARRLAPGLPASYLNPPGGGPSWPALLQRLEAILLDETAEAIATAAAVQTFDRFARAGSLAAVGCPA
ncbi:biliverdin-producing heme oxygenase [Acidisoma silvae]|uniref:Biliverdin-producing heme oxygenase n=1 Tax=Acidisoma silvae TaxID=2802396 RepID=A0A963YT73_9PROT|nr:biliverdin-producing heme oxygenase [Acidisoma silvae]MCB8876622.1 biliverdin-producing heme oxygenase [Acidisoma silvae]